MNYDLARVYEAMNAIRASVRLGFDINLSTGEEMDLERWIKSRVEERESVEAEMKSGEMA